MKSRKERRAEARKNGVPFEPQYNGRVVTKAEYEKEAQELKELRNKGFQEDSKEEVTE